MISADQFWRLIGSYSQELLSKCLIETPAMTSIPFSKLYSLHSREQPLIEIPLFVPPWCIIAGPVQREISSVSMFPRNKPGRRLRDLLSPKKFEGREKSTKQVDKKFHSSTFTIAFGHSLFNSGINYRILKINDYFSSTIMNENCLIIVIIFNLGGAT